MSDPANPLAFHPARSIEGSRQAPVAPDASETVISTDLVEAALACAHLCFGLIGAAVIDTLAGRVVRSTGDTASVDVAAAHALRCWPGADRVMPEPIEPVDGDQPEAQLAALDELQWRVGNLVCTALPVTGLPHLLMLGIAHRDHSDPAQVRWQLKVAANQLAHRI